MDLCEVRQKTALCQASQGANTYKPLGIIGQTKKHGRGAFVVHVGDHLGCATSHFRVRITAQFREEKSGKSRR